MFSISGIVRCLALVGPLLASPALAHPHAFVGVRSQIITNATGEMVAIRHVWTFDEMFSSYAKQGLDKNGDGIYSREELQELAEINVTSVEEFSFFTRVSVDGKSVRYGKPRDHYLEEDAKGNLVLNFTLPLALPTGGKGQKVTINIADPEYWVAMEIAQEYGITITGEGKGCMLDVARPKPLDASAAKALSQLGPDVRQLPGEYSGLTAQLSNTVTLTCP